MIIKQGFHNRLAIIEITADRYRIGTIRNHRSHLALLYGRHAAIREQDEDIDRRPALKGFQRSRSGITTGRA